MNKERILALADRIEADPEHFYIGEWVNECGTVGCLAWNEVKHEYPNAFPVESSVEWGMIWDFAKDEHDTGDHSIPDEASRLLGLSDYDSDENPLFHVGNWTIEFKDKFFTSDRDERAGVAAEYLRWYVANN